MLMLSCRFILMRVTITVAWVASVGRVSPATEALDRKSESHAAFSPWVKGGMSDRGFVGSKVRSAKLTGCLLMVTAGVSLSGRLHERAHQPSEPMSNTSINAERGISRREGNFDYAVARVCLVFN